MYTRLILPKIYARNRDICGQHSNPSDAVEKHKHENCSNIAQVTVRNDATKYRAKLPEKIKGMQDKCGYTFTVFQ